MKKETAIGKKLKISESQQYIMLAVLGASMFLGVALALVLHFVKLIAFNAQVITEQDQSIISFSNLIRDVGICTPPKGDVYNTDEINRCDPSSIELSSIPGTLRSKILTELAANEALNSVPKNADRSCVNPSTNRSYTYEELNKEYSKAVANGSQEMVDNASTLIKRCSALRIVPDALPAFKNEDALLSSLNQLFIFSGWEPESISPSGDSGSSSSSSLNSIAVSLTIEADSATTMKVLNNIERSIREFNIESATIELGGSSSLNLRAMATAYYMNQSSITPSTKTISGGEQTKTTNEGEQE